MSMTSSTASSAMQAAIEAVPELASLAPKFGQATEDAQPGTLLKVRVIRSPTHKDGFIIKDLGTGKVGFITPPTDWETLAAGQIWTAELGTTGPRYFKAKLVTLNKK